MSSEWERLGGAPAPPPRCKAVEGLCECALPEGHDDIHRCGGCLGSWHYLSDGRMMPDTWPDGARITGNLGTDLGRALFGEETR